MDYTIAGDLLTALLVGAGAGAGANKQASNFSERGELRWAPSFFLVLVAARDQLPKRGKCLHLATSNDAVQHCMYNHVCCNDQPAPSLLYSSILLNV